MNRNSYDTDVTVWSPQGRLFQVEYAMEAVQQGSACVGAVSRDVAVLVALKRNSNELSSYQKKIFKIDDNMGIVISGLTADARTLTKYVLRGYQRHARVCCTVATDARMRITGTCGRSA